MSGSGRDDSAERRALLVEMYRRMFRIRRFEEVAIGLVAKGEIPGSIHSSINQEASLVGATIALRIDDYMTGNHRSHGHPIGKGAPLDRLMAELLGRSGGVCKGKGGSMHLADFSVGSLGESGIVGSGVPVAVGAGLSARMRKTDQVAISFFGDGAANEGAVHEAMNLAAVWKLPVIFFCENNQWAVTTPVAESTAVVNISDRAVAYSMPGVTVDGLDPVAVYEATLAAVDRARAGDGPSLVEARMYRVQEHSERLLISANYRDTAEVESWASRDPLPAFARRLAEQGVLDNDTRGVIEDEVVREVDDALEFARSSPPPNPADAFDDLYAEPLVEIAR